jgi:hypothetical protein
LAQVPLALAQAPLVLARARYCLLAHQTPAEAEGRRLCQRQRRTRGWV